MKVDFEIIKQPPVQAVRFSLDGRSFTVSFPLEVNSEEEFWERLANWFISGHCWATTNKEISK